MSEKAPPTAAELAEVWTNAYNKAPAEHMESTEIAARAVAARLGVELAPEEPERLGWFMKQELPDVAADEGCVSHSYVSAAGCLFAGNKGSISHHTLRDLVEAANRAVRALRELESGNYCRALRILRDGDS